MGLFNFLFGWTMTNLDSREISNAITRSKAMEMVCSKESEDWDWHPNYKPKLHGEFRMYARIESEISKSIGYEIPHPLDMPYYLTQEEKLKGIEIVHDLLRKAIINQHMHDVAVDILINSYQAREHGHLRM